MLQLMAGGGPVEVSHAMGSVKKLARLAFVAQQFGYEYADARYTGSRNNVLKLVIVPDHSPQARARAAQNWAQYPNAMDGVSLPPVVPDALELLKAQIQFDLTGKSAEKRLAYGVVGITVGLVLYAVRKGGGAFHFAVAGGAWVIFMAIMGLGFLVTRRRNAKFARRLQAAGFLPVREEGGRVRYLSPGAQYPSGVRMPQMGMGVGAPVMPQAGPPPVQLPVQGAPYSGSGAVSGPYGHPQQPQPHPAWQPPQP
ncbi:hypothetical protein ABZX30_37145 [Streptomyces sp. NPDC004542]|uniref:hypothetical protein n=1 Tax=Streptomyces sp. NPDC004542 TaxID=3154281 RepID=UPI0033A66403